MNKVRDIINFMGIVEKLCLVNRDNYLSKGGFESDSDHIFKLTFLIMLVYPYLRGQADYAKMLELALVHDLAEAETGDISLIDHASNPDLKKQKQIKEFAAMEKYKNLLPPPLNEKIYDLFLEYEQRQTREAKLVKALDLIDANIQANSYNGGDIKYWNQYGDGDWYYKYALEKRDIIKELGEEILSELEEAMIELTKENMKKCKISI
ncbi:MAG: HD domain-containing protein [Lactobacillaceae bacterium]|jgi:putative hydrolase of HD superfamily|nr:HD domain-containing protein [Lactobacillaceae bacterium]